MILCHVPTRGRSYHLNSYIIFGSEICFIFQVEPNNANEKCKDDHWIQAMKEELY